MASLTVPDAEAHRLGHLAEYASPAERARNQLILVVTVFAVGVVLRLLGQSWWVTVPGAAGVGLVVSIAVLEAWERGTGRRSARTLTEDRLSPAKDHLFSSLSGFAVRGDAATAEHDGLTLTVSIRLDATPLPRPEALKRDPVHRKAPLPLKGTRYPPSGGAITVVPAAWLWVEVRTGADPRDAVAEEVEGLGAAVLDGVPPVLRRSLDRSGAAAGLRRALAFNRPWVHRLSAWPQGLVLTTPLTQAAAERDLEKIVSLLGRWHRQRLQDPESEGSLD